MFKSLFWKQFALYIGTLIISFTLLAIATSQAFKGYFVSRRESLLQEQAARIVGILLETTGRTANPFGTMAVQLRMEEQIKSIQSYMDASVLFIDADYKVYMATTDMRDCVGITLSDDIFGSVMNGEVVTVQGQLTELFPTKMLTVAYPIAMGRQVAGAVVLNASIPELEQTISDVVRITVISIVVTAAAAFVFIYFSSRTIVRPLLAMNEAAKVIAGGDFEKRITVGTRDEVGQLGESFNNMAESLARQEKLRREFLSNVSHDLRTPLTSIRGFLQAILDGAAPPEETERYLGIALEETERLSKLANDLLDLNTLQGAETHLTYTEFDAGELIRKTAAAFEARMTERGIALFIDIDEGLRTRADSEKIQRVVYNLIDNAVKFTPQGESISLSAKAHEHKIHVKIKDSGCGISAEAQQFVFERFYKADKSRSNSGSGLGLSIVLAFIKAHGESISLASEEGRGSEFAFTLERAD